MAIQTEGFELAAPERGAEKGANALRCVEVRKRYAGAPVAALDGVCLEVGVGERVALLGPNGAGKTTLVRAICGRVRLDGGEISLFGESIKSGQQVQRLGVVPQEIALYPDLTAKENLEVFAKLHGLRGRRIKQKVDQALQWTALSDRANELVRTFSGGMKRRVNLACGVLHDPMLILLDEPTVGVDPQSRQRIFDMLDELNRTGTSIVLTTHHLDEAQEQSDRIIIMDHGKVIASGSLPQLLEQTTGMKRQMVVQVAKNGPEEIKGFTRDLRSGGWMSAVDDVAKEIPVMLQSLAGAGAEVTDMEIRTPNLHHVFLHLTGRELRE